MSLDFIHVICHILSSHQHRFAKWDSIRQMQVRMTIVRDQIHCLVPKNDAVAIVIENDCDSTGADVLKRGLRTLITSNVIWIKTRLPVFVVTVFA